MKSPKRQVESGPDSFGILRQFSQIGLAIALLFSLTLSPFSSARAETVQQLVAQAKKEGQFNFIWTLTGGQQELVEWLNGFQNLYGFRPNLKNLPNADMTDVVARLAQEHKAGQANSVDVFVGSETHLVTLIQEGALQKVDWSFAPAVKSEFVQADGQAVLLATRTPGVTYNSEAVPNEDVPHTMQALLKTGHALATTPYGTSLAILASPDIWGADKTMSVVKQLSAKASGLISCGQTQPLLNGDFDLFGLDCGSYAAKKEAARGAPLKSVVLKDAAIMSYFYIAIPKNAAHPASAKLWANYMLTRQAQDILYKYDFLDLHLLKGSKTGGEIQREQASGTHFINVDYAFAAKNAANSARLRKQFQEILEKRPRN